MALEDPAVSLFLVVNGKLYSPRGGSFLHGENGAEIVDTLKFKISLGEDSNHSPGMKLQISALRPSKKEKNPSKILDHESNLFFPAAGLFNYKYSSVKEVHPAFHMSPLKDLGDFRYLEFGAKEVIINAATVPPRLKNPEMEVDLARLVNTAKNAKAIPNAVLELSCLIYGESTDLRMKEMERALFYESASIESPISPPSNPKHIPFDSFMSMYKKPGSETSSTNSPQRDTAIKEMSMTGFKENSPPKLMKPDDSKSVCFNCYAVGHREKDCPNPKKAAVENKSREIVYKKVPLSFDV